MAMEASFEVPQYIGGGPHVFVKNTFIDVDCGHADRKLHHANSSPPTLEQQQGELGKESKIREGEDDKAQEIADCDPSDISVPSASSHSPIIPDKHDFQTVTPTTSNVLRPNTPDDEDRDSSGKAFASQCATSDTQKQEMLAHCFATASEDVRSSFGTTLSVPQYIGCGPQVYVKNTFIDVDDVRRERPTFRHAKTAPSLSQEQHRLNGSEADTTLDTISNRSSREASQVDEEEFSSGERDTWERRSSTQDQHHFHAHPAADAGEDVNLRGDAHRYGQDMQSNWGQQHAVAKQMAPVHPPPPPTLLNSTGMPNVAVHWMPVLVTTGPMMSASSSGPTSADNVQRQHARPDLPQGIVEELAEALPVGAVEAPSRLAETKASSRARHLGQGLKMDVSAKTGHWEASWRVDVRKLRGNIKQLVSPTFDIPIDDECIPFKMTLYSRGYDSCKGGSSFEKSRGRGYIQLRCDTQLPSEFMQVEFCVTVGNGNKKKSRRGPVRHDFSQKSVASLPKGQDEWGFYDAVDRQSETFVVTLEILSSGASQGGAKGGA
jgi:hypothetical protein